MAERSGRRARSSLTPDEILDAAEKLALVSLPTLTMRALAVELGSSPMALYNYFTTKDELVDALLNRVFGRLVRPAPTGDWAIDFAAFARAHRDLLAGHPWAVIPLFTHPNPGINSMRTGEFAFDILARGGITGDAAVIAFSGVLAINYGWCAFSVSRDELPEDSKDRAETMGALLQSLPLEEFPRTVSVAASLAHYGSEEHYETVLGALVSGLSRLDP